MTRLETLEALINSPDARLLTSFFRAEFRAIDAELYRKLQQEAPLLRDYFERERRVSNQNIAASVLNGYKILSEAEQTIDSPDMTEMMKDEEFLGILELYVPLCKTWFAVAPGRLDFMLACTDTLTNSLLKLPRGIYAVAESEGVSPEAVCASENLRYAVHKELFSREEAIADVRRDSEFMRITLKEISPLLMAQFVLGYRKLKEVGLNTRNKAKMILGIVATNAPYSVAPADADILIGRKRTYLLEKIDTYYGVE